MILINGINDNYSFAPICRKGRIKCTKGNYQDFRVIHFNYITKIDSKTKFVALTAVIWSYCEPNMIKNKLPFKVIRNYG